MELLQHIYAPFYLHGLALIPAWESNFIPHFIMDNINDPYWD